MFSNTFKFKVDNEMVTPKSRAPTPPDIDHPPSTIPLKPLDNRYDVLKELGVGSFGSVTLARALFDINDLALQNNNAHKGSLLNNNSKIYNQMIKKHNLVAIKTMMTRLSLLNEYKRVREVKFILTVASNKHLIEILEVFIDTRSYQLHIVMEYMEQNLYQMMRHRRRKVFSYPSLKSILAQILSGIKHIHSQGFFHRDIKPENILISPSSTYFDSDWLANGFYPDNYVVKLADFGLARDVTNKNPYTAYVSTRWYRSPEILLRNGFYSKPLDIWAFGCVAIEVTTFKPLFPGSAEADQIWKIMEVLGTPLKMGVNDSYVPSGGYWEDSEILAERMRLEFPYVRGYPIESLLQNPQLYELVQVIKGCLKWDPNKRSTATELASMDFFQDTILQNHNNEFENEEINSNINVNSTKETKNTNIKQALIFAGINDNLITKPLIFNENNLRDKNEKLTIHEFLNDIDDVIDDGNRNEEDNGEVEEEEDNDNETIDDDESNLSKEIDQHLKHFPIPKELINDDDDEDNNNLNFCDHDTNENNEENYHLKQLSNEIDIINKENSEIYKDCFSSDYDANESGSINQQHITNNRNIINDDMNYVPNLLNLDHNSLSIENYIPGTFNQNNQEDSANTNLLTNYNHHNSSNHFFGNITF